VVPPEKELHGEHEGEARPIAPPGWKGAAGDRERGVRSPSLRLAEEAREPRGVGTIGDEGIASELRDHDVHLDQPAPGPVPPLGHELAVGAGEAGEEEVRDERPLQ
jgi:hypothetical protein